MGHPSRRRIVRSLDADEEPRGSAFHASGTWRDANGAEIPSPKPLAQANSRSGAVVNFEGDVEPTGQDGEHAGATDSGTPPSESPDGG